MEAKNIQSYPVRNHAIPSSRTDISNGAHFDCPQYSVYYQGDRLVGKEKKHKVLKENPFVYIHKIEGKTAESTARALDKILSYEEIIKPGEKVAIKVNLGGGINGVPSSYTDPLIVEGVIDKLREIKAEPFVCEANMRAQTMNEGMLKRRGYYELLKRKSVPFVNLSEVKPVEFYFLDQEKPVLLPEVLLNPRTKIISLACPKHHWECGVTLCQKNMYGAIWERKKSIYHYNLQWLDQVIAGAARVMKPELSIIGARYLGAGLGPHFCIPILFNCLIISNDMLSADKVGSELLGYPYEKVKHLMLNTQGGEIKYHLMEGSYIIPGEVKEKIKRHRVKPKDTILWRRLLSLQYRVPSGFQYRVYPKFEFIFTWINKLFYEPKGER